MRAGSLAPRAGVAFAVPPIPRAGPIPDFDIGAVGVLDVGQGSSCLVYDHLMQPVVYFDLGYPGPGYQRSPPPNLAPPDPVVGSFGPCFGNTETNPPVVVLSHWDFDHWGLAQAWYSRGADGHDPQRNGPRDAPWMIPAADPGPLTARDFVAIMLANARLRLVDDELQLSNRIALLRANGEDENNSGLVMIMRVNAQNSQERWVALPADASFGNVDLAGVPENSWIAITAVHHGANTHGAAQDLPGGPAGGGGLIAYSYGAWLSGGVVNRGRYGHPNAAAIGRYRGAGWTVEQATAEGGGPRGADGDQQHQLDNRGNILIGPFNGANIGPMDPVQAICTCNPPCVFKSYPAAKRLPPPVAQPAVVPM